MAFGLIMFRYFVNDSVMNLRFNVILTVCSLVPLVVGSVLFAFDDLGDSHNPIAVDISLGNDFWCNESHWCNESQRCDSGDGMTTGKDYCRWSQTKGLVEGSCFFCDGSERAAICEQKNNGGGCTMDTQRLAICGFKLDGTCVKDASFPTGAKCKKTGSTTSQQCKIPTCK